MEIALGRANANQQLCRFIWEADQKFGLSLAEIDGGNLANAIPRDAHAVIGVPVEHEEEFHKFASEFDKLVHAEFKLAEGEGFTFEVKEEAARDKVVDAPTARKLVATVFACPNGVQGMSLAIPGLVETSCNVASVKMVSNDRIEVTVHQRSSVDSRRDEIADRVKALFSAVGAEVTFDDAYVGWAPNPDSKVLKVAEQSFEDLFHYKPRVEALHAGLECGLFLEKMPNLDMVSFGPTLKDIHSPNEKANIASVGEFWKLLTDILRRLAE